MKATLLTLMLALLCATLGAGCNTMKGVGKDTEKLGEKIQEKATR